MNPIHGFPRFLALAASALAIAAMPARAANPGDPLTPVIPVAATTIPNGSNARIAAAPSGNYVVVWSDSDGNNGLNLLARVFNADGSPRSNPILIANGTAQSGAPQLGVTQPVSMNASGDFVVTYTQSTGLPSFIDHVYVQRYAADGSPRGSRIDVAQEPGLFLVILDFGGRILSPAVAFNDSGEIVVAWGTNQFSGILSTVPTGESGRVYSRRYRADGTPDGALQFAAFPNRAFTDDELRITMSNTRSYAIGYRRQPTNNNNGTSDPSLQFPIFAQIFSADGLRNAAPTHFAPLNRIQDNVTNSDFALTYVANGDLALTWAARDTANNAIEHVLFRRFSILGFARGDTVEVATRAYGFGRATLSISPLPAGGVAITWPDVDPNTRVGPAYGRYYAANDAPLGNAFLIADGIREVTSTTDARGNLLTAYGDVFARVFQGP